MIMFFFQDVLLTGTDCPRKNEGKISIFGCVTLRVSRAKRIPSFSSSPLPSNLVSPPIFPVAAATDWRWICRLRPRIGPGMSGTFKQCPSNVCYCGRIHGNRQECLCPMSQKLPMGTFQGHRNDRLNPIGFKRSIYLFIFLDSIRPRWPSKSDGLIWIGPAGLTNLINKIKYYWINGERESSGAPVESIKSVQLITRPRVGLSHQFTSLRDSWKCLGDAYEVNNWIDGWFGISFGDSQTLSGIPGVPPRWLSSVPQVAEEMSRFSVMDSLGSVKTVDRKSSWFHNSLQHLQQWQGWNHFKQRSHVKCHQSPAAPGDGATWCASRNTTNLAGRTTDIRYFGSVILVLGFLEVQGLEWWSYAVMDREDEPLIVCCEIRASWLRARPQRSVPRHFSFSGHPLWPCLFLHWTRISRIRARHSPIQSD